MTTNYRRWCMASIWITLFLALRCAQADGIDERNLRQLGIETWTVERGLAGNWVSDVVETPDGYVWIATSGGLSRFDGRRFTNWTAADTAGMPSNSVQALATGRDGRLWIGFERGGVRVLRNGRLQPVPGLEALASLTLRSLALAPDGNLWTGTTTGLYRGTETGVQRVPIEANGGDAEVMRVAIGRDGSVWARTRSHGLWRVRALSPEVIEDAPACVGTDLALRADGSVITSCVDGVWERGPNGAWRRLSDEQRSQRIFVDSHDVLWNAGESGLERFTAKQPELLPPNVGVGDYRARALYEDRRGDLWVGTFAGGLSRLHVGVVQSYGAPEGLAIDSSSAVLGASDGTFWIGLIGQGLVQWSASRGIVRRVGVADGLPSAQVWSLAEDSSHPEKIYLGTALGLFVFDASAGRFAPIVLPGIGRDPAVNSLYLDEGDKSTLWVATASNGLYQVSDGTALHADGSESLGRVRQMTKDFEGTFVIAAEAGLFRMQDGRPILWQPALASLRGVWAALRTDADTIWITSESHGISRWFKGEVTHYGTREGLRVVPIFSLQADPAGRIWTSSDEGLLGFWIGDFERWANGALDRVPMVRLGVRDGLRQNECNGWGQPTSWQSASGDIVYPTPSGLAVLTPGHMPMELLDPANVRIDAAWAGRQALDVFAPIELTADQRALRLRFSAPVTNGPESLAFRYRLAGADRDWVAAGPEAEAAYAYLAPGDYAFRVAARLPGQDWVEAPAPIPIHVTPHLIESRWFSLLLAGAAFICIVGALLWRLRLARRYSAALSAERTFLHKVIDTCPEPIFVQDRHREIMLANEAAAHLGANLSDAAGNAEVDPLRGLHAEVLATHAEHAIAECRIDVDGAPRWFRVIERPVVDDRGDVTRVVGSAVDITSYKGLIADLRTRESELEANRRVAQALSHKLMSAQEDERRRLGRELHDDITQRVAGLAMLARSAARGRSAPTPDALRRVCDELGGELERLTQSTQAMSRELHPAMLDRLGLADALEAECTSFAARSGANVAFMNRDTPPGVGDATGLALYRIAQEALRNAVQHGGANKIDIELSTHDGRLLLEIRDDGAGFDVTGARSRTGLGIASMTERAQLVGADIHISSVPGGGTCVRVEAPLTPRVAPDSVP